MWYFTVAALSAAFGIMAGAAVTIRKMNLKYSAQMEMANKLRMTVSILDRWLQICREGGHISDRLLKRGYKSVAIYGMNLLGKRLYEELKESGVEVKYLIDKRADQLEMDRQIIKPEEYKGNVDAMIVTAVFYFDSIEQEMSGRTVGRICSFQDILKDE